MRIRIGNVRVLGAKAQRPEVEDEPDRWGLPVRGTIETERREKGGSAEVCELGRAGIVGENNGN
jgi:hypothetical protein